MPTKKQLANLKRGGIEGTPQTAARARAAKASQRAAEEEMGELAREDPGAALVELWVDLAGGVRRLTRRWLGAGGDPSRELVTAWRECRMLTSEVAALLQDRAAGEEARRFFEEIDGRVAAAVERMGSAQPQPVTDTQGMSDPGATI